MNNHKPRVIGWESIDHLRRWLTLCEGIPATEVDAPDYDPASMPEEEYVSLRYHGGDRRGLIAKFYEGLRLWETYKETLLPSPPSMDPTAALHPDISFASIRAGIQSTGKLLIRLYRWEHREALRSGEVEDE